MMADAHRGEVIKDELSPFERFKDLASRLLSASKERSGETIERKGRKEAKDNCAGKE